MPSNKPQQKVKPKTVSVPKAEMDFQLVNDFLGYRNKEDKTNLPPGFLVEGSKNVVITTGNRLSSRKGYSLDGQRSAVISGITSAYDWTRHTGISHNLRAGNSKLQFRYVASAGDKWQGTTFTAGQIYWIDLMTGLSSTAFNFAEFWDFSSELKGFLLFVNGASEINEWSGGVTKLASVTANTITKAGTTTFAQEGFYNVGVANHVLVNGVDYTYTGGGGTTTLTGVTPDPTINNPTAGELIIQQVKTTANSGLTGTPATMKNDLISNLKNQIYLGSLTNQSVYVSKVNNYKDYSFASPRAVGEGAILTLDVAPKGFISQEDVMYITGGLSKWYSTKFTLSADLTKESLEIVPLKASTLQAAQSQSLIAKIKNSVVFINNEPSLDELGRITNNFAYPQSDNISDPIKNDFDSYDFTDGNIIYHKYFIYVSVPKSGIVLVYNMAKKFWEAPQYLPVAKFSIISGNLYGHSYSTPNTYKLFDGYNDDGHPIPAQANFSYQNYGTRSQSKFFNEFFVEGYISSNSTITLGVQYDIDGCATNTSYNFVGDDSQIVCLLPSNSSLGKVALGKNPLGGNAVLTSSTQLPPKFRVIQTFPRKDFYEAQYSFSSLGTDYRWEILAFGPLVSKTPYGNNLIKK